MRILAAAVLVAAVAAAAPAFAAPVDNNVREVSSSRIEIGAVDFRDAGQVRAFHKRLQQAALFVCGSNPEASREQRAVDRACAEKAMSDAVSRLNRPLLTATYQQAGAPMVARGY